MLIFCIVAVDGGASLDRAASALESYKAIEALMHLDRARGEEPHRHADHVRLYELYGVAYAYLQREEEALEAFDMVLALDPGYAVSYTLSPQVTFIFEQARKRARGRQVPNVHVSWPLNRKVNDSVPVFVEVVADPKGFLKHATLHVRRKGAGKFSSMKIEFSSMKIPLSPPGKHTQVLLPPVAEEAHRPGVLQLHLTVYDERGNEVLLVGTADRPREIYLGYDEPVAWYRKWWVWAIAGGCIAAGSGVSAWLLSQDMPDSIGGSIRAR